ncbi:hypothetical protein [Ornithinibacillus xuwenensis]|uniref:Peptidyl-prolyl cis-trans isomerase n=1 Tax=Ornithinibacillus xuwenensis TaxID=3144668 RepID=A0ABU9XGD7_9BACI
MIVPIIGNVAYSITMDPTVWIFDDRKIILEEAFNESDKLEESDTLQEAAERWDRAISRQEKPPVNKSLSRHEREDILKYSYVMPIDDFLNHAEINSDATHATIATDSGEVRITLQELYESYLLFAIDGKPLTDDGPVHLMYKDGSNRDTPLKGVNKIVIN